MRLSSSRLWCTAFAGFLLMIAGWSLAAPYDGSPDEIDHVVRAVGVVSGEIAPPPVDAKRGTGAFQTVPRGLVRTNCWAFDPTRSAACAEPPNSDRTPVVAPTGAGRYFPAYYAIVGWPLEWWPGWTGLFVARLISGAMCAALIAGAVGSIVARSRHRLMLGGVLVALTPMATYIAGSVNPNGVEIAAGIAYFTGLVHLFVGRTVASDRSPPSGLLWLVGLSGLTLAVFRASSPLWLVVGLLAVLTPWSAPNVRLLVRSRAAWIWTVGIGLAGVCALVWIIAMRATDLGNYTRGLTLTTSQAWMVEAENWRSYLDQAVGVTGWLDTRMSGIFYLIWQLAAGALLFAAVVTGRRVDRWRMAVLAVGGVLAPAYLEVRFVNDTGFITQGRYLLPMLAGLVLFAAFVLEERGLDAVRATTVVRSAAVLLLPIHLICLLYTMARWQRGLPEVGERGITSLDPTRGDWHPVVGWLVPLVAETLGLLVVGAIAWYTTGARTRPADHPHASPPPPDTRRTVTQREGPRQASDLAG